MRVSLVDYTGAGAKDPARYAANILIFTKSTRLKMSPDLLVEIESWSEEQVERELAYMANTIPSSWEFCDYTFLIEDVTRAFTHQLVRTRTASFAQQTMRVLDMERWGYSTGPTIASDKKLERDYSSCMTQVDIYYRHLIKQGAAIEDARGVLPTNILTNIVMKCNMRTFVEMVRKRSSPRTQGEYREVLDKMKDAVLWAHPWAKLFLERTFDKAAQELDQRIQSLDLPQEQKLGMIKLVDQMRNA